MNKQRMKKIGEIFDKLNDLKNELYSILEDETDYYNNVPENLQNSERATQSEDSIEKIDDAICCLENCTDSLEQIQQ